MYKVTGIKTFRGMDGQGLNATIRNAEGDKVAEVLDEGSGGEVRFHFVNKAVAAQFQSFVTEWWATTGQQEVYERDMAPISSKKKLEPAGIQYMMEVWINTIVDEQATTKKFDKAAKKKTLFRVKGDPKDEWRTLTIPYSDPRAQTYLDQKFAGQIETIWGVTK